MSKRDYYEVLGVSKSASGDEIKKAYRRLAMKHHPDRNSDDQSAEARFKEAKEAYEVLRSTEKRAAYDQFGHDGLNMGQGGPGGFGAQGFGDIFGDIFGDAFGDILGGGGRRRGRQVFRGADLGYELRLDLEDAVSGDTVVVGAPRDDDNGNDSGSVYVFVKSGETWTEQQKLNPDDGAAEDYFGKSVSIYGDTIE